MSYTNFTASVGSYLPSNSNYHLHCHDEYEIYMFLEGDSKYVVEEKNYPLNPDDIIIIRKNEMHRVWHNSNTPYRRLTITISPEFFKENDCQEYERVFLETEHNQGNKIHAELVHTSGLFDAIQRLKVFTGDFTDYHAPVAKSGLIEILYYINKISSFESPRETEVPIQNIIHYLNNHFADDITLDSLCAQFFISKYYLCRAFKKYTGLTVQQYIKEKRLSCFEDLRKEGRLLTECASLAGFHDYSAFYRVYVKKYGHSPEHRP